MVKVIVADDEVKVCQLICHLIDWEGLGMELVGVAHNGIEALELISQKKPDLVLTDIRMPGCNGLELLKRVHEDNPDLEFIIISGYSHFEYAQTAIQYGISDYILKPVNREQLEASLRKVCQRQQQKAEAEQEKQQLLRQTADISRLRDKLWQDLERRQMPQTLQACNETYGYEFTEGMYQIFCIRADFKRNEDINQSYADYVFDQLRTKARTALESRVAPLCREFAVTDRDGCLIGLTNYVPDQQWAVRSALSSVLNGLCVDLHAFEQMQLHLSVSRQEKSVAALPDCLDQAQLAMSQRLFLQDTLFLETLPDEKELGVEQIYLEFGAATGKSLDLLSTQQLATDIGWLQRTIREKGASGRQAVQIVQKAYYLFLLSGVFQNEAYLSLLEEKQAQFDRKTEFCSTYENLFRLLQDACLQGLEELRARLDQEKVRPIALAKRYIEEHYAEPLSLDEVCSQVGFSASYFSTLFRKETGQTFLEYLSEVRIEEAKKLFRETRLTMEAICQMVGIHDYKRFAKNFKKVNGISPKEYRNLYS